MSRLLYHGISRSTADTSPFDHAILEVAKSSNVRIVSPYIGISYLERILDIADSWRMISDIEAWLSSLSVRARPRAWEFIRENLDRIHHCEQIHAKSVIGETLAMFGSANLTMQGILARTELGMLINEPSHVRELQQWFDALWENTASPVIDETSAFVAWLDEEALKAPDRRQSFALAGETRRIRARLVTTAKPSPRQAGQLNLTTVAQELVVRDQVHYTSLDAAVIASIDALASHGFKLGDLIQSVKRGYPAATTREAYFLLLQHCANHPRSVFVESTVNRLVLNDGRFMQSDKERLFRALEPYRDYLYALVQHLDFDESRTLPQESKLQAETGVSEREQVLLVGELLDCGFLVLDDRPGELPKYSLEKNFDWSGRFHFFEKARLAWTAQKSKPRQPVTVKKLDEDDNENVSTEFNDVTKSHHMQATISAVKAEFEKSTRKRQLINDSCMISALKWFERDSQQATDVKDLAKKIQASTKISREKADEIARGSKDIPRLFLLQPINESKVKTVALNSRLTVQELVLFPRTRIKFGALKAKLGL